MKRYDTNPIIKKSNQNNILSSQYSNSENNINEDELVTYIKQLSSLIKQFYNLNNQNFNQLKTTFNNPIPNNKKEIFIGSNKDIINSFQNIEKSFSSFYSNAKDIFHKMRITQNQKNGKLKKNESINKITVTNNNINISNSIIHNESSYKKYSSSDLEENLRVRFDKGIKNNKDISSQKFLKPLNKYINHSRQISQNFENYPISLTETLNNSDDETYISDNDSEKYKKILNKFSKDVCHFINSVQQLQNIINFKDIQHNFKLSFEREKNFLYQSCLKYLSNTNPKISITNTPSIKKTRNLYNSPIHTETVKIESEYDKLRNDFDNLNKELFITQRENNELKNEIDKLRKNSNYDDLIKINIDKDEENEIKLLRNNSYSSLHSQNEEEYKKNFKIIKNENENMKSIITNLSKEIAEIKKKNYELSPKIENNENEKIYENKIHSTVNSPMKEKVIPLLTSNAIKNNKNDNNEIKIANLNKKNSEMQIKIKEMNIQRNNCLNIIKQNENKIKEQQNIINKYLKEIEKLKSNSHSFEKKISLNDNELKEKIDIIEKNNKQLKNEKDKLDIENKKLEKKNKEFKNQIVELENKNNEYKNKINELENIQKNYQMNELSEKKKNIEELKEKNNLFEKKNSSLSLENEQLNKEINELTEKIKKEEKNNKKLNEEISELNKKIEKQEKDKIKITSEKNNLTKENKNLKNEYHNLEKDYKIIEKEKINLEKKNQNLKKENQNFNLTNKNLENDYQSLEKENEDLKKDLENLKKNYELNCKENEELNNKLKELLNNNKDIDLIIQKKNKIEDENEEIKKEILQINVDNKKLKKENKNYLETINKLKTDFEKENDELTNEINQLNKENKNLKDENLKIKNEYEKEKQKKEELKSNLIIENTIEIQYISIIEMDLKNDNLSIDELKKKLQSILSENKKLNQEKENNYKEIEELKIIIDDLKDQLKLPLSLNYLKTNSKFSFSSYIIKKDDNEDNDKLSDKEENDEKTLSIKHDNKSIYSDNEQSYSPIMKKKSYSKFKNKSVTDFEINNIQIEEIKNNIKFINNISPETHELIKIFQYNRKIKWFLFKIKNLNKEENFEDFIWKEQKSRKDFSEFKNIPKNDSIELQRKIENLEEKKKELEKKLIKKESDYNRLSVNYAKLFNRKKNDEKNPDKLRNDIEQLKKENKNLQNIITKYKESENIFGLSFIEDDIEGNQFIDELNFDEIIDNMSKYGIFTYGNGKKDDNSKERLKKNVNNLISQITLTKNIKICLGTIFKQLNVSDDDIYELIGKYKL